MWFCDTRLDRTGHVLITLCFQQYVLHLCPSSISNDSGALACHSVFSLKFSCLTFSFPSTLAVEAPDNLPFPDGKEVSPEIIVETLPGTVTAVTQTCYKFNLHPCSCHDNFHNIVIKLNISGDQTIDSIQHKGAILIALTFQTSKLNIVSDKCWDCRCNAYIFEVCVGRWWNRP